MPEPTTTVAAPPTTYRHPILLTEVLQFHPQLLLDDVVNVAFETLYHAVEALEVFLLRWAEDRPEAVAKEVDGVRSSLLAMVQDT
jgi:kinetochore protein Mis12/MTW1